MWLCDAFTFSETFFESERRVFEQCPCWAHVWWGKLLKRTNKWINEFLKVSSQSIEQIIWNWLIKTCLPCFSEALSSHINYSVFMFRAWSVSVYFPYCLHAVRHELCPRYCVHFIPIIQESIAIEKIMSLSPSPCVCVCIYVYVWCTCSEHLYILQRPEVNYGCHSSGITPPPGFETRLLTSLELTKWLDCWSLGSSRLHYPWLYMWALEVKLRSLWLSSKHF